MRCPPPSPQPITFTGPVEPGTHVPLTSASRVLVTGAAGFIGFHLSMLLRRHGATVVGLDSFTDYYSLDLKRARAAKLRSEYGVSVMEGTVCDRELLSRLLGEVRAAEGNGDAATMTQTHLQGVTPGGFTHVVHLAAQPGVRYAQRHPFAYVGHNVECFVNLMESLGIESCMLQGLCVVSVW